MFLPVPPRPEPASAPNGPAASADEEADLRAVVGSNVAFYLASWRRAAARPDSGHGFNRAAFFLAYFWLGYRRMYSRAFALFGIILAETVLAEIVFCDLLGWPAPPMLLTVVVGFTLSLVCGARANRWYLEHARRVIAEVRQGEPPQPGDRVQLAARGGTTFAGGVAVVCLCFVVAATVGIVRAALHELLTGG